MPKKYILLNDRVKVEDTRFLLTLNKDARELYILHREYPRCLIYVEQTVPMNFIVVDFFEDEDNTDESISILTSTEFKDDLKQYVASQAFNFN